jgi:hypothetical protein
MLFRPLRKLRLPYPYLPRSRVSEEPARSTLDQASLRAFQFFDSAGDIFSMYLEFAREEDKKMAEGWKADADGILIFVGFHPPALCFTQLTVRP